MARSSFGVGRLMAEALIVVPALALGLAWSGLVLGGLMDKTLIDRHLPEIARLLSLLFITCVSCFGLGVVLFVFVRGRRPPH